MMRNFMKKLLLMATLLVPAILVACGDGGNSVSGGRYVEGNIYSESRRTALEGGFSLNARLAPVAIEATVLDQNLDSIGTIDIKLQRNRNGQITFVSDSIELMSSLLRIKYSCVYADSSNGHRMGFVQYVDIDKDSTLTLSLLGALQSKRIESLVQEDGFDFEGARRKSMRDIRELLDLDTQDETSLDDFIYQVSIIEEPDTAFYARYVKLRDTMGDGKTWRDLFSETEIADPLFRQNKWEEIWMKVFELPTCDSSSYKDTAGVKNKESAFYGQALVCDNPEYANRYRWRLMTELEIENGVCTYDRRDTVLFDSLLYTCDSAKTNWQKMPSNMAVLYLFGNCSDRIEGDFVFYDTLYYACLFRNNYFVWTSDIPANLDLTDPVNIFVRKQAGLCDASRDLDTARIEDKYYMCRNNAWRQVDKLMYYFGICDSLTRNKKVFHDSVGYFMCKKDSKKNWTQIAENTWTCSSGCTDQWEEIPAPDYYGNKCTVALENSIQEYDGVYYICKNKWKSESECFWRVVEDSELSAPLKHGKICTKENNGEVVEIDGSGYWCVFPNWGNASDYHLSVLRAIERNKLDHDYCRNGSANTTIFWDEENSALYGCINDYTKVNHGWGEIRRATTSATAFTEFNDPKNLLGGIYEDDEHYTISRDGWKYTFNYYVTGVNDDRRKYLRLQKVVPASGTTIDVAETNGIMVFWAASGDSTVTLDKVEERSPSFDNYFANWKQKIIESTRCPNAALPGISCVSDWDESTIEVKFNNYNENSYTSLEQAKAFCQDGARIPSAEEWQAYNYMKAARAMTVEQVKSDGSTGKFSAKYSLAWTSTEKDTDTQYCFEYVTRSDGWSDIFVASGIVECPKDLYPMVQAICVSDGREE